MNAVGEFRKRTVEIAAAYPKMVVGGTVEFDVPGKPYSTRSADRKLVVGGRGESPAGIVRPNKRTEMRRERVMADGERKVA